MTVAELIAHLSTLPQDLPVVLFDEADPSPFLFEVKDVTRHPYYPNLCVVIDNNLEDKDVLEIPEDDDDERVKD